ncbi:cell division protein FtsK [Actinosynnema mirum]|uniref:Cell divisionFtsK/SpoIIIE n=1 Tax=Actinosynnema mirum (strain ATCC 29888 / DSM 43827 / JCM 3225 / NBRC 14064 / NCIMB 13271 / NRRL B-12336 / IMRU 3971 / 101) TaxID=446462 RepID=C6WBW3_ACTMD|nr:cell division protein FtsK [Actinosynnema mirum]ACU37530.1 cell divisionFtsK/SpoIIIE [Actinosynnema mirum DSM 43827]
MNGDLVPVEPVLDGEVVAEPAASVRLVPVAWRSRQAWRGAPARLLRLPLRFFPAVGRGALVVFRAWRRWVRVRDYREAAEQAEKLADKYVEIRELGLYRWRVTGMALGLVSALLFAGYVVWGGVLLWGVAGGGATVVAVIGRRKDGSPGRKAVMNGARVLAWTMDGQLLVDAFRDAKLIGKDEALRLVERPHRVGDGWAVVADLPATRKAADVIKNRDALASALAVDEVQLVAERVRGRGGHAGRVSLWVADEDPYAGAPLRAPLLDVERWDAWRAVPFGRDARGRRVDLPLVWTSLLVGAIPRQGKTFATRLAVSGLVLDPYARLYVFDGKGGKDWEAAEQVAYRYVCGDEQEHAEAVRDHLVVLVAEVQGRYARMATVDDELCPESKITPALSRDPDLGMPVTGVVIDEVQVYLENTTRVEVGGRKTTLGLYVADLLTYLVRKGPAAGIVVVLATQRPDSNTIPSRLRAVLGSRFALRVMDWRDSNIVLGEQMNTRGYDASTLLPAHRGVGILRPDGEMGSDVLATTVRTYYLPNPDWRTICTRGRALRESAGTLAGHAAGDDSTGVVDPASVARAVGDRSEGWVVELPEPLASVVEHLGDELHSREFVPSAELIEALGVEAGRFAREMGELGCRPLRQYVPDGEEVRRVRGYLTSDIRTAIDEISSEAGEGG